MGYIGAVEYINLGGVNSTVQLADLTTEITDKLLGTNNVTTSHLHADVVSRFMPDPSGNSDKVIQINSGEDGFDFTTTGGSADQLLQLDGEGKMPALDGTNLTGVITGASAGSGIWLTPPNISGVASGKSDGTQYGYTGSGSSIVDPDASTLSYHWALSRGTLSATTGTNVNVSFEFAQAGLDSILSVYTIDDIGNQSATVEFNISIAAIAAPSGLVLSVPSEFNVDESAQLDVTVGDDGADAAITYSWERSLDGGSWLTTSFSNASIKSPTLSLTTGTNVQVRCTVSNSAGSNTATSSSLAISYMAPDVDSSFLDSSTHILANEPYDATIVDANTLQMSSELTAGSESIFSSAYTYNLSSTYMGNNTIVVCYEDNGNSDLGTSCVGLIDGDTINWGTPQVYSGTNRAGRNATLTLDDNHLIVMYRDYVVQGGTFCIGTVNGTSVSWTSPAQWRTSSITPHITGVLLDTDKVVIIDNDYSTVGTFNGATISWETPVLRPRDNSYYGQSCVVSANMFVVCYEGTGNGESAVVTLSGVTLSWGTADPFQNNTMISEKGVTYVGDNKVVVCYRDHIASKTKSCLGTISGTNITWETSEIIDSSTPEYARIAAIGSDKVIAVFSSSTNGYARVGNVVGTTITWEPRFDINSGRSDWLWITAIGNNKAVVSYEDGGNNEYGTSRVLQAGGTPYEAGDVIQLADGKLDTVASVSGTGPQDVVLTNETAVAGTVYRMSPSYTVPSITQENGQDPFKEMVVEAQWTRNTTAVTEDSGDVVIDHGGSNVQPFRNGDNVVVSGDTDVVTTINAVPVRDSSIVTGSGLTTTAIHTGYVSATGTVTVSAVASTYYAWELLDNNLSQGWLLYSGQIPCWWQYEYVTPTTVGSYNFVGLGGTSSMSEWTLSGSNDESTWIVIDTKTGENPNNTTGETYSVDTPGLYTYYRFDFTDNNGHNDHGLLQMTLFEGDYAQYTSTISVADALPANAVSIEPLPLQIEGDLNDGTIVLQDLTETFEVVNGTTAKATATVSGDEGAIADIRLTSNNVDLNDLTVTRIDATFQV